MSFLTRLISRMLVLSGYNTSYLNGRKKRSSPSLTILAYHRIGQDAQASAPQADMLDSQIISATTSGFDWQLDFLQRHFEILSFPEVIERKRCQRPLPTNTAVLTFDDGYRDNYELAYPILLRRQLPATIYLVTGLINTTQNTWWDEVAYLLATTQAAQVSVPGCGVLPLKTAQQRQRAREKLRLYLKGLSGEQCQAALVTLRQELSGQDACVAFEQRTFITWDEARTMQQNGISFGAHTHTHPILTRVPVEQAESEIALSIQRIDEELDGGGPTSPNSVHPLRLFAYPNGRRNDFNDQTRAILAQQQVDAAVTLMHGSNEWSQNSAPDWLALRRIYVGSDDRMVFMAKVSGALENIYKQLKPLRKSV